MTLIAPGTLPIFINEESERQRNRNSMSKYEKTKLKVWAIAEDPTFSKFAKIYALISTFLIVVSVVTLIIETVDSVTARPNAELIQI